MIIDERTPGHEKVHVYKRTTGELVGLVKRIDTEKNTITFYLRASPGHIAEVEHSLDDYRLEGMPEGT